ncbi:MAG: hypothetical protein ACK50G_03650 [bacterium]
MSASHAIALADAVLVLLVAGAIFGAYLVGHRDGYRDAVEDFE